MKRIYLIFICMSLQVSAQSAADISVPSKRVESLDLIRAMLTTKVNDDSPEAIEKLNPFNPKQAAPLSDSPQDSQQVVAPVGVTDREILTRVIDGITPSGTMQVGGVPILLFGQKKLKVGDRIPIEFQGATYELHISAIERISFTLRLNNEEITRPIKSASTSTKP